MRKDFPIGIRINLEEQMEGGHTIEDSKEVVKTLDVPRAPQEVQVRPDGQVAYVSCDASGQVAEIGLAEMKVGRLIPAGPMVDGLAWAARP